MIKINLLPYREIEKKENIKRQITILAGSFILFVLFLIYVQSTLTSSVSALEKNTKEKEDRLVILTKKLGDIEGLKRDIKELEQKLAVIKGLEENRLFPVRMLDEMSTLAPVRDLWLEKLTETETELRIEGIARNNIVVSRFMKSLELSSVVSSVSLVSTKQKEVSGLPLMQFNLLCTLKKG